MSSTPEGILSALLSQLQNHASLDDVEQFAAGYREDAGIFPGVYIEPVRDREEDYVYGIQRIYFTILIIGVIHDQDEDKQLIGDENHISISQLKNNIVKAISSDRTLGGVANFLKITDTDYDREETACPRRACGIEIEVEFEQDTTTRA